MARGETFELTDLLAAADSAMYAAKQAGRNQVAFAPPLRDMGIDAAWNPARRPTLRAGAPEPASTAPGYPPMSSHRVVLVRRSKPPLLYAFEGDSPCSLGHCTSLQTFSPRDKLPTPRPGNARARSARPGIAQRRPPPPPPPLLLPPSLPLPPLLSSSLPPPPPLL